MLYQRFKHSVSHLLSDRKGNFAAALCLAAPVVLLSGAIATDYTGGMTLRARLSDAVDSAAAATAAAKLNDNLSDTDAELLGKKFLLAQLEADGFALNKMTLDPKVDVNTVVDADGREVYKVDIKADARMKSNSITTAMFSPTMDISVHSKAESSPESIASLSMFLVLDKSGSMGWDNKMDTLKVAVGKLMLQLDSAQAPVTKTKKKAKAKKSGKQYVRTGAIAYDSQKKKPDELDWGTQSALDYTKALKAGGGTNSAAAMKVAWKRVRDPAEDQKHLKENGKKPGRYIVFMTDGANNQAKADTTTKKWCNKAKKEEIKIYSVAFKAPKQGQKLLKACATDDSHYFDANSSEELVKAFEKIGKDAASKMARITK